MPGDLLFKSSYTLYGYILCYTSQTYTHGSGATVDLGITGKKAIVNGGSAGMGRGAVLSLAREGVDLVVSARGERTIAQSM